MEKIVVLFLAVCLAAVLGAFPAFSEEKYCGIKIVTNPETTPTKSDQQVTKQLTKRN